MEFEIKNVLSLSPNVAAGVQGFKYKDDDAYAACAGSGAVLQILNQPSNETGNSGQKFYYEPPSLVASPEIITDASPSPGSSPSGSTKLQRVNKTACLDVGSTHIALGECGGYLPRVLLFDLDSQACLDTKRDQHSFGVLFLKFSPNGKFLVSVGTPQDGYVYVYSVANNKLEVVGTNKCIASLKDVLWINDQQFITIGVRHAKIWTFDGKLTGRSVILGELANQSFESVCKLNINAFLVGTSKGQVYKLPDPEFVCEIEEERPVTAMVFDDTSLVISTALNVYIFQDSLLQKQYPHGAQGLYYIPSNGFDVNNVLVLPSDQHTIFRLGTQPVNAWFSAPGLKLRNATCAPASLDLDLDVDDELNTQTPTAKSQAIICWYSDENTVYKWPNTVLKTSLSEICAASYSNDRLMVASLNGDVEINNIVLGGHSGPVTDCHITETLAVSSGRDKVVKIWQNVDGKYKLANELLFSAPVLKVQLFETSLMNALVCCGANKLLYFYTSQTCDFSAAKTIAIKGSPYDMKAFKRSLILSTNDKHVSIYDPFSDDKLKKCRSWRPQAMSSVYGPETYTNLHLIQPVELNGKTYLVGSGSNKCIMLYTLSGDLVCGQWGHGELVSGVAWTGSELITAGETVFVSTIGEAKAKPRPRDRSPVRGSVRGDAVRSPVRDSLRSPRSPVRSPVRSPGSVRSPTRSPIRSPIRSPTRSPTRSPVRSPVRSPTQSPVRSPMRPNPINSPTRPPEPVNTRSPFSKPKELRIPRSSTTDGISLHAGHEPKPTLIKPTFENSPSPSPCASPPHSPSPLRKPGAVPRLEPLSMPSFQAMLQQSAFPPEKDSTKTLEESLKKFVNSEVDLKNAKQLEPLLIAALAKIDGLAAVDVIGERLASKLEASFRK